MGTELNLAKAKPKLAIRTLASPISGESKTLTSHPDLLIAKGFLGKGVCISPISSRLVAPCKAKVIAIAPTGHQLTLGAGNGLIIELIIGKNAKESHGVGFSTKVKVGEVVAQGQVLVELDLIRLKASLPATAVAMLISKGALKMTPYHGSRRAGEDDIMQLIVKENRG